MCKILFTVAFLCFFELGFGQCSNCSFTITGNTSQSYDGSTGAITICITGNTGNLNLQNFGSDDQVCIASGISWTQTNALSLNGCTININDGTFLMNTNMNFNNPTIINIGSGGSLKTNQTNLNGNNGNLTINNRGTINLTSAGSVTIQGININNFATGIVNGTTPSGVIFVQGNVTNSGSMVFSNFENNDMKTFINSGNLIVQREFNNHGNLTNTGCITTECGNTSNGNSSPCEFYVGNKGSGVVFSNSTNGCISTIGSAVFDGPFTNNSSFTIIPVSGGTADFTVNTLITNTGGNIILQNGVSTIGAAGQIIGGNFKDANTNSGFQGNPSFSKIQYGFDANNANPPYSSVVINSSITTNCICPTSKIILPLKIIDFGCKKQSNKNLLTLILGMPDNLSTISLQVSVNGQDYTNLGIMQKNNEINYSYTDPQIYTSPVYYRIEEIDLAGKKTYSNSIMVYPNFSNQLYEVFPNPGKDIVFLRKIGNLGVENEQVFLYNTEGKEISKNQFGASSVVSFNLNNLASGEYLIAVIKNGVQVFLQAIIKTR